MLEAVAGVQTANAASPLAANTKDMKTPAAQENYFQALIETEIIRLKKRVRFLRAAYYFLSVTTLGLSAIMTIILGYNFQDDSNIVLTKNIALMLGATITLLSGLNTFWKLETYWIRRKITLKRLQTLKDEFEFQKHSGLDFDLPAFFAKYQSIQHYSNIYWEDVYNDAKTEKKGASVISPLLVFFTNKPTYPPKGVSFNNVFQQLLP